MLLEKVPHRLGSINIHARMADYAFWQRVTTRPGMPAAGDGVEGHLSSAVFVLEAAHLSNSWNLLRGFIAPIAAGENANPLREVWEGDVKSIGWTAAVWDNRVGRAMKNDRRHRS